MRQTLDEGHSFALRVQMVLDLEEHLSSKVEDAELDRVKTLRDLAVVVERRLAPGGAATSQAISVVRSVAERYRREASTPNSAYCDGVLNFDIPLLEAIAPRRWNKVNI